MSATNPTPPGAPPSGLCLHIGGEEAREGWKILNVETRPGVDYVGNCTDLSRFADGSVEAIYASHVYEHLSYQDELPAALVEARRVLRAGGTLRAGVPDLEAMCRLFLAPSLTATERYDVMRMIYGGQTDAHDYHKVGLTFEFFRQFLLEAGFREVRRVPEFGLFNDTTTLKFKGVRLSLNVTATA